MRLRGSWWLWKPGFLFQWAEIRNDYSDFITYFITTLITREAVQNNHSLTYVNWPGWIKGLAITSPSQSQLFHLRNWTSNRTYSYFYKCICVFELSLSALDVVWGSFLCSLHHRWTSDSIPSLSQDVSERTKRTTEQERKWESVCVFNPFTSLCLLQQQQLWVNTDVCVWRLSTALGRWRWEELILN